MRGDGALFVFGGLFGCLIGGCVTSSVYTHHWEKECIRRNVAEYDKTTGEWKWAAPVVEAESIERREGK